MFMVTTRKTNDSNFLYFIFRR